MVNAPPARGAIFPRPTKSERVLEPASSAAWVALQVADLALPGLGLPDSAIRYIWVGAFLGFPLAVFFTWRYEVTRNGVVRTPPASGKGFDARLRAIDWLERAYEARDPNLPYLRCAGFHALRHPPTDRDSNAYLHGKRTASALTRAHLGAIFGRTLQPVL